MSEGQTSGISIAQDDNADVTGLNAWNELHGEEFLRT